MVYEWVKLMMYKYTREFYLAIKKNYIVCKKMGRTGEHHVKQSKPGSKSQRSYIICHLWKLDV
jgi:hypothetical protein